MEMKILIFGNSKIFIEEIRNVYSNHLIDIISWRDFDKTINRYDLIFVCGIDKHMFNKEFKKFIYDSYLKQYFYIKKICCSKTKIIYVNTNSNNYVSFSRHEFSKNRLAYKLNKFKNYYEISFDTILGKDNNLFHTNNLLIKFILKCLINLSIIKTIDYDKFKDKLSKFLLNPNRDYIDGFKQKYYLIKIPRTEFVDKILKLITLFFPKK
jgi:hypothetical protein